MMTSKHTPGPWMIDVGTRNQQFIRASRANGMRFIARMHPMGSRPAYHDGDETEEPTEEAKANARLIAAAPEMLEALELIVSAQDTGIIADPAGWTKAFDAASAAIAKANGSAI